MTYTISRYCPCTDGAIIGDFRDVEEPIIECRWCAETHYFKRVLRWNTWDGTQWEEWELNRR